MEPRLRRGCLLFGLLLLSPGAEANSTYGTTLHADAAPSTNSVASAFAAALSAVRPGSGHDAAISATCARYLAENAAAVADAHQYEKFRFALWSEGLVDATFLPWTARFENEARAREAAPAAATLLVSMHFNRWGIASATDEKGRVTVVVIVVDRRLALDPMPRTFRPGESATFSLHGITTATARIVLSGPTGRTATHDVPVDAQRGSVAIPLADGVGRYDVEVVLPETSGPLIAASFPLAVGIPFPEKYSPPVFPAEAEKVPEAKSAASLVARINASRARYALPPLATDATLAAVARKTSVQAKTAVASAAAISPLSQRLDAGGSLFLSAEELTGNGASSAAIHAAWMGSPTHRLVLLDNRLTHIGIGVATGTLPDKTRALFATAIVAELVERIDPKHAPSTLLARVNERRVSAGAKPLRADPALTNAAARHAAAMAADDLAEYELPGGASVFDAAKKAAPGAKALGAAVGVWTGLDQAAADETLMDPAMERIGIGIVQKSSRSNGRGAIWIATIVAR